MDVKKKMVEASKITRGEKRKESKQKEERGKEIEYLAK
jgi:hypothetical protein